jgi:hypothetical protein
MVVGAGVFASGILLGRWSSGVGFVLNWLGIAVFTISLLALLFWSSLPSDPRIGRFP